MKKLLILSIAGLFLLAGCVSYRSLDFTSVTLGMTKAEVRNIIGPPERVLAVNQTTTGYLEVLQYRTRYDEVYALEFWNDRLSGYEFLYEDYIYVPAPYPPVAPPWGQPIFPGYRPPTVKPKPPVKPQPQPTPEPPTRPGTGTTNPTTPTRPGTGSITNPTSPTRPSTGGTNTTTPTTPTRPSTGNLQGTSSSGSNATTPTRQPSSSSQTNTNTGSGTTNTRQNSGSENSGGGSSSGSSGTTTRRSTE